MPLALVACGVGHSAPPRAPDAAVLDATLADAWSSAAAPGAPPGMVPEAAPEVEGGSSSSSSAIGLRPLSPSLLEWRLLLLLLLLLSPLDGGAVVAAAGACGSVGTVTVRAAVRAATAAARLRLSAPHASEWRARTYTHERGDQRRGVVH